MFDDEIWIERIEQDEYVFGTYFVTKIVLTYCEKKLFYLVIEKNFLATECFFNLFLEVSHI